MANIFDLFDKISSGKTTPSGPVEYIICGLGNPGEKYTFTRHNAGFMALDYLCEKLNFKINKIKFKAICGETVIGNKRCLFMKPQTFMNLSGEAIIEASTFYKIPPENIVIIYDDISLDVGTMRVKRKGSAGGHNGIKSIIANLGTEVFPRIKLGVGKPADSSQMVDWVLGNIPKDKQEDFYSCLEKVPECLQCICDGNIEGAMNQFN